VTDCHIQEDHQQGNREMLGNFPAVGEMSGISVKIREMSGKKSCQGKLPKKHLIKICINRLFSITRLLLYASYFMLFIA